MEDYVKKFNEELLKIDRPDERVTISAFLRGLYNHKIVYSLSKSPIYIMEELMRKVEKHIHAEDSLHNR